MQPSEYNYSGKKASLKALFIRWTSAFLGKWDTWFLLSKTVYNSCHTIMWTRLAYLPGKKGLRGSSLARHIYALLEVSCFSQNPYLFWRHWVLGLKSLGSVFIVGIGCKTLSIKLKDTENMHTHTRTPLLGTTQQVDDLTSKLLLLERILKSSRPTPHVIAKMTHYSWEGKRFTCGYSAKERPSGDLNPWWWNPIPTSTEPWQIPL